MSRTTVDLDDQLVSEALRLTNLRTKKELVQYALQELVARKRRKGILVLAGKVRWEGNLEESRNNG